MKNFKKILVLLILLIGIFSFSKPTNIVPKISVTEFSEIEAVLNNKFECRPSTKMMFYVETSLVKKSRGYNTVNATVYVLDRVSGQSKVLTSENIIIPFHKDAFLQFDKEIADTKKIVLENGDQILDNNSFAPYTFNELIKYDVIYNSYLKATNKLLKINRIL